MIPVLRFAPSPNGLLHLGHAYSALMTAAAARQLGGKMLLRIEDIDIARSKPEFRDAILEDLEWLGVGWSGAVLHQSERFDIYESAASRLLRDGLLYACFCSRAQVAASANGTDPDGAPIYPGTCRHFPDEVALKRIAAGEPCVWRLAMKRAIAAAPDLEIREFRTFRHVAGELVMDDLQTRPARPLDWGDVVVRRKDTPTSYHLSVVVDDAAQQVSHVTRGMDLYRATDVQVQLQALLGLPHPIYAHHDLIRDENDTKLAKSRSAPSLRSLRQAGMTAAEVRAQVGF
ncbi:tRNA glutamyl-Q(34) synthetase GluQRS [Devosia sp.]|uniref:tRNA glutamyl-Q(34) synthetase GluQRS n=1 Tax=Devosia sp. TaxID=1871048 RepID=UPI003A8E1A40